MQANKLPLLESSSPKLSNRSLFKFEITCYGAGEKLFKQPNIPRPKRHASIAKQTPETKKMQQNILLNSSNDDGVKKQLVMQKVEKNNQQQLQEHWEQKFQEQVYQYLKQVRVYEDLKLENIKLKMQLEVQEQEITYLKLVNSDLRQSAENANISQQYKKLQQDYKETYRRMDELLRTALDENYESQTQLKNIKSKHQQLEQFTFTLKQQLRCRFCQKELQNAITVIPCAHNYCQKCIQGYLGKCYACNDDSHVQTTYHNDYMADIIQMYQTFENILNILKP